MPRTAQVESTFSEAYVPLAVVIVIRGFITAGLTREATEVMPRERFKRGQRCTNNSNVALRDGGGVGTETIPGFVEFGAHDPADVVGSYASCTDNSAEGR
jgi:hypothetical protein